MFESVATFRLRGRSLSESNRKSNSVKLCQSSLKPLKEPTLREDKVAHFTS